MKKTLSILLAVLMILTALPIVSFAAGTETLTSAQYDVENPKLLNSGTNYVIPNGETVTVKSGYTMNVPLNTNITVEKGGQLIINGQLDVYGSVDIYGTLVSGNAVSDRTGVTGAGAVICHVSFASLAEKNLDSKVIISYLVTGKSDIYSDLGSNQEFQTVPGDGLDDVAVPYGTFLYVHPDIDPVDEHDVSDAKYDDSKFPVLFNGNEITGPYDESDSGLFETGTLIPNKQNVCAIKITTGGSVNYGSWIPDNFIKEYTIYLPEGDGFKVYGRSGEYGEVKKKYGERFSFYVEVDEDYNQSSYTVYAYDGKHLMDLSKEELLAGNDPLSPDSDNYYTLPSVIQSDWTIEVEGVMSNKTLDIFAQVFSIFREVWTAFMSILSELNLDISGLTANLPSFSDLFSGLGI